MTKKRNGRPKIKLDYKLIEGLAHIQCTQKEIADVLDVSTKTLQRDEEFCRIYKKGMQSGKISLRRLQWKSADKENVKMLIYLGKQYLGQKEGVGISFETPLEIKSDELKEAIISKLDIIRERVKNRDSGGRKKKKK